MQSYSYPFSRTVIENFKKAKLRGWTVFCNFSRITEDQVIKRFMQKDMVFWETFKRLVSTAQRDVHLDGPSWSEKVWSEIFSQNPYWIEMEELLNKCLVLTKDEVCAKLGEHVKPEGKAEVDSGQLMLFPSLEDS